MIILRRPLLLAAFITACATAHMNAQTLYVANGTGNTVGEYNATTGAAINATLITGLSGPNGGPYGLAVASNSLYVTTANGTTVGQYNATTGAVTNASFVTGLNGTYGLAVSGNSLYVQNGKTGIYNATTGAAINAALSPASVAQTNWLFSATASTSKMSLTNPWTSITPRPARSSTPRSSPTAG